MVIRASEYGGSKEVPVPEDQREAPVLTGDERRQLVDLANKIEAFYKKPEDIEWAIVDGKVHLLQSRPITTMIGISLAVLFTGNGIDTTVLAKDEEIGREKYRAYYKDLIAQGLVTQRQAAACEKLLHFTADYADLADQKIVFECVVEKLDVKYEVYKQIEANCKQLEAVASTTSATSPADLAGGMAMLKPLPSTPSRFSLGTMQSVNTISAVGEPCRPIFSSWRPTEKPGKELSTMKAEMPLVPLDWSVMANTTSTSAT